MSQNRKLCLCTDGYGIIRDDSDYCAKCENGSVHLYDPSVNKKEFCKKCYPNGVANTLLTECITKCNLSEGLESIYNNSCRCIFNNIIAPDGNSCY